MDDDYGADDALLEAMAAVDPMPPARSTVQQPAPQYLNKPSSSGNSSRSAIVQPKPQVIQQKNLGSTILVSPRQRGNPVLTSIRSIPWEYSDIPADYVLGLTTCALFLSLKYHRLHPEYIYTRIRNLQGKYNLRILLTLVDIPNHEDSLRELSKTSVVNNVTVMLCWSAAEAARYLELYKSYENANFAAIRGQQSSNYADKLVEFVTVPRSLNKSDAVALVANFGSLKNAINAEPEQLSTLSGWGGIKVKRWTDAVEEPFRARKAAKRGFQQPSAPVAGRDSRTASAHADSDRPSASEAAKSGSQAPGSKMTSHASSGHGSPGGSAPGRQSGGTQPRQFHFLDEDGDSDEAAEDEEAFNTLVREEKPTSQPVSQPREEQRTNKESSQLSEGVAAALAKLRQNG
ncbi:restriction endonuclease type II-like protein [Trichoderma longibrachiatum]|uniref:ERCC1-like central domain-containing protein n=1 Tax=Trichoderma longibrachiatum ATCC 18648 TaxID=983965 RepID=A0A2T4BPK6_TRILO|nr:hypothetical protein M440DRAFT_1153365 [Trichoderma longibrachiatum ATCC 18648]